MLVVTNDFPSRLGGIETFTWELVRRLPTKTVVLGPTHSVADLTAVVAPMEALPRRLPGRVLPTPALALRVRHLIKERDCQQVWFPSAAPLALLSQMGAVPGEVRLVGSTHGHEAGWAQLPLARFLLRKMGDGLNVVTYLTSHTLELIRPAMGEHPDYVQLASGVDVERFSPEVDGTAVRLQHGLLDRQVILCVSRLVPRKGQDILIQALPLVRRSCPDASLLLVGEGPYGSRLRQMAEESPDSKHITFAGAVESADLPSYYAAADVFAMPCRDRQGGREIEGLGIVFLEASASGLPVIAGKSGGSVDAVSDGTTGRLVDGSSVEAVSEALIELCNNPEQARDLGRSGRAWVEKSWTWEAAAGRLAAALQLSA